MPIVRVEMWESRSLEQKREMARICGRGGADSIDVVIDDVKKENWGAGGKLCSDKRPDPS